MNSLYFILNQTSVQTQVFPWMFQVVQAVEGRKTVCSCHERKWLCDQAEVWQPLLLQGVHTGRVRSCVVTTNRRDDSHWPELNYSRLKRTTNVMLGGKQVVVCGYGEVCVIKSSLLKNNLKFFQIFLQLRQPLLSVSPLSGWQGLLCRSERTGRRHICDRSGSYLRPSGLVWKEDAFICQEGK